MASNYPNSLDAFSTAHVDNANEPILAATDNNQADAINKIEAELGVNPSGVSATVGARLTAAEAAIPYKLLDTSLFSGANIDAALTQAKTDLGANGGRIVMPRGDYEILNPPSFAETRSIILEGAGGLSAGAVPATRITYKGTGVRGIDARSSFGFGMRDLELRSDQAGFTGDLLDLDHSIVQDAAFTTIERCRISSAQTNCTLVNLENAVLLSLSDCYLQGGSIGVQGRGAATYSNGVKLDTVTFLGQGIVPVKNPGEGWTLINCGWEALASGNSGAILCDQAAKGLQVLGGWCGDNTSGLGTWFDLSGEGCSVMGARIGGGVNGVRFSATSVGCTVIGGSIASMTNGVTFTSGAQDVCVLGVGFGIGVTNQVVIGATIPRGVWMDGDGLVNFGGPSGVRFAGDAVTKTYRRVAGIMKTDASWESAGYLRTYQGGATSIQIADSGLYQAGSAVNGNLYLDSKGTGQVQINTQNGATGGTGIEAAAGKVGFFGATPVTKRTLAAAATDAASTQTLANSLRQALINLGLGA